MTLDEIIKKIETRFSFTATSLSSDSDPYNRYVQLINDAETTWARANNFRWRELFTTTSLSTTSGVSTVSLPSGYKTGNMLFDQGGQILINGVYYPIVSLGELGNYNNADNLVYITGNPAVGYTLNIQPTPSSTASFTFRYYTTNLATDANDVDKSRLADPTDVTKCPEPTFLIFSALEELYKTDETDVALGYDYERKAANVLEEMLGNQIEQGQLSSVADSTYLNSGYAIGE